jgi:hypothetical protein
MPMKQPLTTCGMLAVRQTLPSGPHTSERGFKGLTLGHAYGALLLTAVVRLNHCVRDSFMRKSRSFAGHTSMRNHWPVRKLQTSICTLETTKW